MERLTANRPLVITMLLQTAVLLAWTLGGTGGWIAQHVAGLVPLPWAFRLQLFACMLGMLGSAVLCVWGMAWVGRQRGRGWGGLRALTTALTTALTRSVRRASVSEREGWVAMTERL